MAKGVEDTCFYIYNRLLSLNEVGGDPDQFGLAPAALHRFFQERQAHWPWALSTTSTHDTKRSEDVRARLNVLSEVPAEWEQGLARWSALNEPHRLTVEDDKVPDPNEEYFLYQTLVGAWPVEPCTAEEYTSFVQRIQQYMFKALHEAKVHTSWINPNTAYDEAMQKFIGAILDPAKGRDFIEDLRSFQRRVSHFGMLNSLGQALLKITAPGVPDLYQGTELWDFSLVDPDNRRPVDYRKRQELLKALKERWDAAENRAALARELLDRKEDSQIKLFMTWQALRCRKEHPSLLTTGAYVPVSASGARAEHVFAFLRRAESVAVLVVVPRLLTRLGPGVEPGSWDASVWQDTVLCLPGEFAGTSWSNVFTGENFVSQRGSENGRRSQALMPVSKALNGFPVGLFLSKSPSC
jgi:(1->4)-alpha-D-glucan 1-alpha-D-glucosylmutase